MKLPFIKMHGLGNDYVYIDCFPKTTAEYIAKSDLSALALRVSDRHFGIGSDGLVLILPSKEADAKMPMAAKRRCAEMPFAVWRNTCTRIISVARFIWR